jgi:hypothetical protein
MIIRKIGVLSLAKIMGALYGLMGLIFGAIFALVSLVSAGMATAMQDESAWIAPLFGVGAVIFLPIMYGCLGVVFGALTAWLYNIVAGMAGGLAVEVDTRV